MERPPSTGIDKALKLDFSDKNDDIWLTRQQTLRKLVGLLGVALPILLILVVYIDAGHTRPIYSISHYYFTRANSFFIIIVSMLAIFLLIYKGKDPVDFYVSSAAGIFALCLLVFPTNNISKICQDQNFLYSQTIMRESGFRTAFHYISAAIFLSCLAYMSFFLFTRSDKPREDRGKRKRIRNRVYRTCAVIMALAILGILANFLGLISNDAFQKYSLTFWFEAIAVWAFGFSWLVKADVFLKDK